MGLRRWWTGGCEADAEVMVWAQGRLCCALGVSWSVPVRVSGQASGRASGRPPIESCSRPTLCSLSLALSSPISTLSCRLTLGGPGGPLVPQTKPSASRARRQLGLTCSWRSGNELVGGETLGSEVQLGPPEETEETRPCPLPRPRPAARPSARLARPASLL